MRTAVTYIFSYYNLKLFFKRTPFIPNRKANLLNPAARLCLAYCYFFKLILISHKLVHL